MESKFLTIDRMEDIRSDRGEVVGVQVWGAGGDTLKVKKGQGGKLKERWPELEVGRAYSFEMGEFKGYPFVQDFKAVAGELVKKAMEKVEARQANTRDRSFALAYAKDLAVAGKILVSDVLRYASEYVDWLGGAELPQLQKAPVTPEATKAPEVAEEKTTEYIALEQRKRIEELKSMFGFSNKDVGELVKSQDFEAKSVKGLTKDEADVIITLIGAKVKANEPEEASPDEEF